MVETMQLTFAGGLWKLIIPGHPKSRASEIRREIVEAGPMCGEILKVVYRWERTALIDFFWQPRLMGRGIWGVPVRTDIAEARRAAWLTSIRERMEMTRAA